MSWSKDGKLVVVDVGSGGVDYSGLIGTDWKVWGAERRRGWKATWVVNGQQNLELHPVTLLAFPQKNRPNRGQSPHPLQSMLAFPEPIGDSPRTGLFDSKFC